MLPCFQFGDFIGPLVEENLLISPVYALIDYIILIFFLWLKADNTLGHKGLWFKADHRLDHVRPEYGQPGTINLYGPQYDQPEIVL